MNKKILGTIVVFLAITMLASPVLATKPTEVTGVWFVWSLVSGATTGNDATWTGDGAILHNHATYTWNLNRSPPGQAGSVVIGNVVTESILEFNTLTQEGNVIIKAVITFTSTNTLINPYGVGTFECTAIAKITSLNTKYPLVFGDGSGFIVSNTGTGDFANAKLTADMVFAPINIPQTTTVYTEGVFFGIHQRVNGEGTIVFH
jgi:hypothetical protein